MQNSTYIRFIFCIIFLLRIVFNTHGAPKMETAAVLLSKNGGWPRRRQQHTQKKRNALSVLVLHGGVDPMASASDWESRRRLHRAGIGRSVVGRSSLASVRIFTILRTV